VSLKQMRFQVFETSDVEEYRDLEIQAGDYSPCGFTQDLYIAELNVQRYYQNWSKVHLQL